MVHALLAAAGVAPVALAGISIGVPGVVDPATRTVAHAVHLGFPAASTPLASLLAAQLDGVPIRAENDLTVAALGAARAVGGQDPGDRIADLAYLALGAGIAAGFLLDGRLRWGAFGGAGEIGHIPFVADGPVRACGQRGCLERYASGASLDARWPCRADVPAHVALFATAAAGDPAAVALRDEFVLAVAAAVRILVLTTDVACVFLGGGVSGRAPRCSTPWSRRSTTRRQDRSSWRLRTPVGAFA